MTEGFVDTQFGRVHYVDQGTGSPLLLAHSGGTSLHEFDQNFDRLAATRRVIAWDLIGHGDSDALHHHMSVRDHAQTGIDVLDHLSLDRAAVAGCSIGGILAVELGANFSERITKAVIVDVQLRPQQWWIDNFAMVETMFTEVVQSAETVGPRFRNLTDHTLHRWNIDRTKAGAHSMMDVIWAVRDYNLMSAVTAIKVPALTILGEDGPSIDCADDFRRLIPGGQLVTLADCGHFPMIDDPRAFETALIDFLDR